MDLKDYDVQDNKKWMRHKVTGEVQRTPNKMPQTTRARSTTRSQSAKKTETEA